MTKTTSILLFTFLSFTLFFSCNRDSKKNIVIEGDLYFSFLRLGNFYNQPDSLVKRCKYYVDTVNRTRLNQEEKNILAMYETLKAENLLYSPYVDINLPKDSVIKLYLDKESYEEIKQFKREELQANNKKVTIKAEVRDLGYGMVLCKKLISVTKVDGRTWQVGGKFKIDDYQ